MTAKIVRIDAWNLTVPLPNVLRLGHMTITTRHYTLIRVEDSDGVIGQAYALSRGAPVDVVVAQMLAPVVLGRGVGDVAALRSEWLKATSAIGMCGILMRAWSLLDIALWDIRARQANQPLWRLLGGQAGQCPVMLVEGYPRVGEGDDAFAERLASRAAAGVSWLKIANVQDAESMRARLGRFRELAGFEPKLVVDIAWTWESVAKSIRTAREWKAYKLEWIEDPHPVGDENFYRDLHSQIDIPLGAGDDVSDVGLVNRLIGAQTIDVVRVDATTIGGISIALELIARASESSLPVSLHVYPEIHRHLAFASEVNHVESYGPSAEFDRSTDFLALDEPQSLNTVHAEAPTTPGLGFSADWDAVETFSDRHESRVTSL